MEVTSSAVLAACRETGVCAAKSTGDGVTLRVGIAEAGGQILTSERSGHTVP